MMADYPIHAKALSWALAQVGKGEQPPGSNRGAFVQFCQSHTWLTGTGWPWCRAFTLTARVEGGDKPEDLSAGAWDALSRAQARGQALEPKQFALAIPGDEVILSEGSGHACMLRSVTSVGGQVVLNCVDGNWGDRVSLTQHPLSGVKGFIHWPEQGQKPVPKPPVAQVVGSASGTRKLVVAKVPVRVPLPSTRWFELVRQKSGDVFAEQLDRPH